MKEALIIDKEEVSRFKRLMTQTNDLTLLVLKGHLLIEEQLQGIINKAVSKPAVLVGLEKLKLKFYEKVMLSKAIIGQTERLLWNSIKKISELRNDLVHESEVINFEERIDDIVKQWSESGYIQPFGLGSGRVGHLRFVFSTICAILEKLKKDNIL